MGQKNSKSETLNLNEIAQLETEDVFKKDSWEYLLSDQWPIDPIRPSFSQ